jgi:hypothetical protein
MAWTSRTNSATSSLSRYRRFTSLCEKGVELLCRLPLRRKLPSALSISIPRFERCRYRRPAVPLDVGKHRRKLVPQRHSQSPCRRWRRQPPIQPPNRSMDLSCPPPLLRLPRRQSRHRRQGQRRHYARKPRQVNLPQSRRKRHPARNRPRARQIRRHCVRRPSFLPGRRRYPRVLGPRVDRATSQSASGLFPVRRGIIGRSWPRHRPVLDPSRPKKKSRWRR